MAKLRILVPQETTNYIKNPSLRYDTMDWNVQGCTVTRTLTHARFGIASLQVVTDGLALNEGTFFRVSALDGVSDNITVSVYVRGEGKVRIRLDDNALGGGEYASKSVQLNDDRWTRIEVSGRANGGDDVRLYVELDEDAAAARTFYVDGAQMERQPYATSYCDGDQDDCTWNGIYHNSSSYRSGETRAGGRWVELSGPTRESEDLYMTESGGLGMAPIRNNIQNYALENGAYHQNVKVFSHTATFTFHAKHKSLFRTSPVNLERLHELRQMLIDVVKPDRTRDDQEIIFEYTDGSIPLYFSARYDGGLEGEWDVRNSFVNSFPLRLLITRPAFDEDSQEAKELDFQESQELNYVAGRINGQWSNLNYGLDDNINSIYLGARGEVYIGGEFLTANNNAAAIDPLLTVNNFASWDGTQWDALGNTLLAGGSSIIAAIVVASNGYIYVGGSFTSIGGVAANNIAYWDGSSWNALGSGLNATCLSLVLHPNGDIYAGGSFITAGGNTANRIARWDGSSWHHPGTYSGLNGNVFCMDISIDGSLLYVGGNFTDENGNPGSSLNRIAVYDTTLETFSSMGDGFGDNQVITLKLAGDGTVYAAGDFTISGSDAINQIARWDGSVWNQLGKGVTGGSVSNMLIFENNTILVVGYFSNAQPLHGGAISTNGTLLWNGSTWLPLDIEFPGTSFLSVDYCINKGNDIYLGTNLSSGGEAFISSAVNTIINPGSLSCYPLIYVRGPGKLTWIENQTIQKRIYLNLTVLENEDVTFDFARGTITSSLRGSLLYTLLPGSEFRDFQLLPGENRLACFMTDDVNAQMSIQFCPRHWSADASGRGEEL